MFKAVIIVLMLFLQTIQGFVKTGLLYESFPNGAITRQPENIPTIRHSDIPASYFIAKEESATTSIFELRRVLFCFLQSNQLIPQNFCFKENHDNTPILTDYNQHVPIYIQGHVLRN